MELTNLLHYLMANMAVNSVYGAKSSSMDCGWLFGKASCPSNECCGLDGKCGSTTSCKLRVDDMFVVFHPK
jgi:hypothetical protein